MARVLLVDDCRSRSACLAAELAGWGHVVRFAVDGDSAVLAAAEFRPDAVLVGDVAGGCDAGVLRAALAPRDALLVVLGEQEAPEYDLRFGEPIDLPLLRRVLGCV